MNQNCVYMSHLLKWSYNLFLFQRLIFIINQFYNFFLFHWKMIGLILNNLLDSYKKLFTQIIEIIKITVKIVLICMIFPW